MSSEHTLSEEDIVIIGTYLLMIHCPSSGRFGKISFKENIQGRDEHMFEEEAWEEQ